MLKSQKNSILLVAFHLAILLSPLLAKGFHHHENTRNYNVIHHEKTVSQASNHCYICDFEYLSFVKPQILNTSVKFTPIIVLNAVTLNSVIKAVYSLSSLRAPPSC